VPPKWGRGFAAHTMKKEESGRPGKPLERAELDASPPSDIHSSRRPLQNVTGPVMSETPPALSRSVEDYLKAIYSLEEQGDAASTSAIARALAVQPGSVSGMVKRLAESGFVEHERYRGARLTDEGRREALRIIRRHRILETYLSERLGFSWDDVHEEAERLEHAASDRLIDRMATALKNPSHDPHGAPIPTRAGLVESTTRLTLAETEAGIKVRIRAVQDDDSERLRYMEARGLLPGVLVTVDQHAPFNGPVSVRVGDPPGAKQTVGHELARRIRVSPADETEEQDEEA
jgi:DtxR family transcriptional regulator, Mn-dependent transcriptional regulator